MEYDIYEYEYLVNNSLETDGSEIDFWEVENDAWQKQSKTQAQKGAWNLRWFSPFEYRPR